MVTSATDGWTPEQVLNRGSPSLSTDFSALKYMDYIKDEAAVGGTSFEFRLEARELGRYGGVFRANNRAYVAGIHTRMVLFYSHHACLVDL